VSKEQSYIRILAANSGIQHHIASILEAKARELDKAATWTRLHANKSMYRAHDHQYKDGIRIHEQMIEVIDGITKVEAGLARHLKLALNSGGDSSSASESSLDGLFNL
jgi:hypothetical protein